MSIKAFLQNAYIFLKKSTEVHFGNSCIAWNKHPNTVLLLRTFAIIVIVVVSRNKEGIYGNFPFFMKRF